MTLTAIVDALKNLSQAELAALRTVVESREREAKPRPRRLSPSQAPPVVARLDSRGIHHFAG